MDNHRSDAKPHQYESCFSSEDVIAVTGINDSTLQNWLARGDLRLKQQNPGRGRPRQYTLYEVSRIRFIKRLVDLAFPLAPAFKITAALQRLWEAVPGGHEAYSPEPNFSSWLFVAEWKIWERRRRADQFPLNHSPLHADDYVAIWAVEQLDSRNRATVRDAINFFGDAAIIVVNMGALLKQTQGLLMQRVAPSGDA